MGKSHATLNRMLETPTFEWERLARDVAIFATGLLLLIATAFAYAKLSTAVARDGAIGYDLSIYLDQTRSWLNGTGFYLPRQLTGVPYPVEQGDAFYPPVLLVVTLPFALGLPAFLWWAMPLGLLAFSLIRVRPSVWTLPILAALLAYPRAQNVLICGNPSMWAFAFLAAGLVWHWPAALVPLKVTMAPFALVGIRWRSWWIAAAVGLVLCMPFGAMWGDWLTATLNARLTPENGLDYVLGELPIAIGLVAVAWLSRWRRETV